LTITEGLNYFVSYPSAQGPETFPVGATVRNGLIVDVRNGITSVNSITFDDLTIQTSAGLTASSASTLYAPITDANLLGVPTAPTASISNNSNQIANTAFVQSALSNLDTNLLTSNNTWTGNNIFAYGQVPSTTSSLNGIGFAWNNIPSVGDTSIINYAGGGLGGFNYYVVSQTRMPDLIFNMNPNNATFYVPLIAQTPTQLSTDISTNLANTAFVSTAL
jgi:hypothetical protein